MSSPEKHREKNGSYAESVEKQAEFEELVREEDDDWQEAVDDVIEGERPKKREKPVSGM